MKKIEIVPNMGEVIRYPIFLSAEALYMYMDKSATLMDVKDDILIIELDGAARRKMIVEWMGVEPGPMLYGIHPWMRIIRGVVEAGHLTMPVYEPFRGWCHPSLLPFSDWVEPKAVARRVDDHKLDLDAIFADNPQSVGLKYVK